MQVFNDRIFLSIPEAAQFLGLPESTFRKLVAKRYRKIPLMKLGKKIIFKRDLLEKWAEKLMLSDIDL
jgi:excisionase family DNA binding protein